MHRSWNIITAMTLCLLLGQPVAANDTRMNRVITSSINLQILAKYLIDGHISSAVVETVIGAGGDLAVKQSINSQNSGLKNLLFIHSSPYTVNRYFNKNITFDRDKDTIILPPVIAAPFALVSSKFKTLREIQEHSNTDRILVGSTGSITNIMNKILIDKLGIKTYSVVYYRNHSDLTMALIRKDIDYTFVVSGPPSAELQIPDINILGTSGYTRLYTNPDVPLFTEIGLKEMNIISYDFFATPNTRNPTEYLNLVASIFKDKKNIDYLRKQNMSVLDINNIDEANRFIKIEISNKYNIILRELEK